MLDFKKMIEKKKKEDGAMPKERMSAKMSALKGLKSFANEMMGEGMKGLKDKKGMAEVSVSSDSPEGLEKGLETAHNIVGGDEENEEEDSAEHGMEEPGEGSEAYQEACDVTKRLSPEEKKMLAEKLMSDEEPSSEMSY